LETILFWLDDQFSDSECSFYFFQTSITDDRCMFVFVNRYL
jgi:hypothetical protein